MGPSSLVAEAPTLEKFRSARITPRKRHDLLASLPDAGRSAALVRDLEDMRDCDLHDVLAELGYGLDPKTRLQRPDSFTYKHSGWLNAMPKSASGVIRAITRQFEKAGTEGLESPSIFKTPDVDAAGGVKALRDLGKPAQVLEETKTRMFSV